MMGLTHKGIAPRPVVIGLGPDCTSEDLDIIVQYRDDDMHVSTLDQLRAVMEELTGAECVSQVALSSTLDFPEEYGLTREGAAFIRSTVEGVH